MRSETQRKAQDLSGRLAALVANIPKGYLLDLGKVLGWLVYFADNRHRRIVRRNLGFAYPEWTRERIRAVSRRVFQNTATTLLGFLQMSCFSKEDVLSKVRIRGKKYLDKAVEDGSGVILIAAHLGNWEMSAIYASCYLREQMAAVARPVQPRWLDKRLNSLRTRFGNTILDKNKALPKMVRVLRQGRALGILIDQGTTRSEGVEVRFFGRTVSATPAAALLAQRYGSAVLPSFCVREGNGRLVVRVAPPLFLQKTKDSQADIQVNTQMMIDAIEKAVRAYPDQWFWFHKRWKRYYPHLYPEDLARRKRRREKRRAKLEKSLDRG
jgi:KDO2-lipid IV(A) lauroyltransferase